MKNFRQESRGLWLVAWPIVVAQLGQVIFGVVDTLMVGRLGTVELAAAAFAGAVYFFGAVSGFGFLNVTAPLVAERVGAHDYPGAKRLLQQSRNLAIALGLLMMAVMGGVGFFIDHFGQPSEVVKAAAPFYFILLAATIPMYVFQSYRQFLEATGLQRAPMYLTFAGIAANALLNYVLIFGKWGFPALGLNGAAIATVIIRFLMMVIIIIICHRSRDYKRTAAATIDPKTDREGYKLLLRLGVPSGLIMLLEVGAFTLSAIFAGQLDKESLAAHQIVINIASMTFMVPLGISFAASVRVGYALGEKRIDQIRERSQTALVFGAGFMAAMTAVIFILRGALATAFSTDETVIALAMILFLMAAIFQLFDGLQVICIGILRAMKDVKMPLAANLFGYWILGLPLGYYLSHQGGLGVKGIWIGLTVGLLTVAIILVTRLFLMIRRIETATI